MRVKAETYSKCSLRSNKRVAIKKHFYSIDIVCTPNQAMFTFETEGHLAIEKGRTINFHHLAVEQRQREIWVVILPHPVF